jgi:hypothetical protein
MEIKDNTFARQFETTVAGVLSVEYSFSEKKIFLTKIIHQINLTMKNLFLSY